MLKGKNVLKYVKKAVLIYLMLTAFSNYWNCTWYPDKHGDGVLRWSGFRITILPVGSSVIRQTSFNLYISDTLTEVRYLFSNNSRNLKSGKRWPGTSSSNVIICDLKINYLQYNLRWTVIFSNMPWTQFYNMNYLYLISCGLGPPVLAYDMSMRL